MKNKYYYKRKLPHWQPPQSTFFITYRLANSIPISLIRKLEKRNFMAYEEELDKIGNGPDWLKIPEISKTVLDSLLFYNNVHYTLWCSCVMSNHVHVVLSTFKNSKLLNVILQNHKKFTAVTCNKLLGRSGQFWAEESFDTLIKDNNHFFHSVDYCILNPVKCGLVNNWREWKWTFLHPELLTRFN